MAKGRKAKPMGAIAQYEHNRAVAEQQAVNDVITPEQRAKGTYSEGRRIVTAHDPVARWADAGRLTQAQGVVIDMCRRLWTLAGVPMRGLTASYGERLAPSSGYELRALGEIEAREDLHRIQGYVPLPYWSIFERVCRWGEAAGVAGTSLGYGSRSAQERAHTVVCFVADIIAMRERVA